MTAHAITVTGDYLAGWRWHCICGKRSTVYGELAAPRRAAAAHVRHHRAKVSAAVSPDGSGGRL